MRYRRAKKVEKFHKKIRAKLANYLSYPKILIGIARNCSLNEEEIYKPYLCLDACLSFWDMEMVTLADEMKF